MLTFGVAELRRISSRMADVVANVFIRGNRQTTADRCGRKAFPQAYMRTFVNGETRTQMAIADMVVTQR